MKVETYEAISLDEQNGEVVNEAVNEEAMALIETLGLKGQSALLSEREVAGQTVTTRNPYRRMTKEEQHIFGVVMPERTELREYRDGAIPLRALQIAAHAVDLFNSVEVWHPEAGRDDPILVGVNGQKYSPQELFLLARWGNELCSLDELRTKAAAILTARMRAKVAEARGAVERFGSSIETSIDAFLHGERTAPEFVSLSLEQR
jgi:hypothetical protein